jgi:hypothetical protein
MYTAPQHQAVAGAFLINPPVQHLGAGNELDQRGRADQYFALYRQKLLSLESWTRLLGGQSSYATLWRVLKAKLRMPPRASSRPQPAAAPAARFNPRLLRAIGDAAGAGQRVAVVYGDREPDLADFDEWRTRHLPAGVSTRVYTDASHGYLTDESLRLLFSDVGEFARSLERVPRRPGSRG